MLKHIRNLLILSMLAFGCSKPKGTHDVQETISDLELLRETYDRYHSLAPRGWDIDNSGDALLWVSLAHVGLREAGPIDEAQSEPGHWFRFPQLIQHPEMADSDISRDMLTGLLIYIWQFKRLDWAEDWWKYGEEHNWRMGQERSGLPETRTIMAPTTISMLGEVIFQLGGEDHGERQIPIVYNTAPGFVSHLSLLDIYLQGEMHHSLTTRDLEAVALILTHMATNPFPHALYHRYTDGDQSEATRLLRTIWPQDRLPTNGDWCEHWRTQRSDGDTGFLPCISEAGEQQHSGGDLLFTAAIVLGLP